MINKVRGLMLLTVLSVFFLYVHIHACVDYMYYGREDIFVVMTLASVGVTMLTLRQYQKVTSPR